MKEIILDIGGIIIDDSKQPLINLFKDRSVEEIDEIYKLAYSGDFKKVLLGAETLDTFRERLINTYPKYKKEFDLLHNKKNFISSIPLYIDTINYIKRLKKDGYNIYFLSNITRDLYEYLRPILDLFDGGCYSFSEHVKKPDLDFYNKIIDKYDLDKSNCIFFDDKQRNIDAGNNAGIKSVLYTTLSDISNNIEK